MEVLEYKGKLEGKSNAHLMTFADGNDYVVKYLQPGFEKSLANEWVAYCLARYLGVPTPFARMVEMPDELTDFLIRSGENIIPTQTQFASLYIADCKNGHQVEQIQQIINYRELASIIVLDYWLQNRDRTKKNILLREKSPGEFHLWAIDHAEIFNSYNWQMADIPSWPTRRIKSATHQLMAAFILDKNDFWEAIDIMQKMPILLIEEAVNLIPDDWTLTKEEKKTMIGTIVNRRKKIVPKRIESFIKKVYLNHANL